MYIDLVSHNPFPELALPSPVSLDTHADAMQAVYYFIGKYAVRINMICEEKGFEATEEDVRAYAIPRIARYKVPKRVFFVEEFPMNPAKKVQKFKLRELAKELTDRENLKVFASEEEAEAARRASEDDDARGGMFREK